MIKKNTKSKLKTIKNNKADTTKFYMVIDKNI